ncbi:MAG: LLM class F420-dependent oxidoreductase, partial [Roseiflexaceae bacterium]
APGRLKNLARDLPIIKERWSKLNPAPMRNPIPLLIGGGGEKVTLKLTAQYADLWNSFGPPEKFKHKNEVLTNWCNELGRDPTTIERTVAINADELGQLDEYVAAGAEHFIVGLGVPFDPAVLTRMVAWRDARG